MRSHSTRYAFNVNTVLLEYFAGEKRFRVGQISRKIDHLRSNYCVLARIVCIFTSTYLGFAILLLRIDQPSQSSHNYV